ncbi:MAG: PAS domain S-box protein [Desulfobacteraceae bacterium]|jgi:PAS domain S-box-containing protein
MNLFPGWLKATLAFAIIFLLAGNAWYYQHRKHRVIQEINANLEAVAKLKIDQIAEWRRLRLSEASVIMESRSHKALASRCEEGLSEKDIQESYSTFSAAKAFYNYRDVMITDANGHVCLDLEGDKGSLNEKSQEALKEAFRTGDPLLTSPYASPDDSGRLLGLIAPYFEDSDKKNNPVGAIFFQYDMQESIIPIIRYQPLPNQSAETLLIMREGDNVLFMNRPGRKNDADSFFILPEAGNKFFEIRAVNGEQVFFQGKDYRGVEVLSVAKSVPGTPWVLINKIDAAEAYSALHRETLLILGIFVFILASVFTSLAVFWQRNEKTHYHNMFKAEAAQRKSEERYRSTLDSMMEGFHIIDFKWRSIYINSAAAKHIKLPKEKILNRTVMEQIPNFVNTQIYTAFKTCMDERKPRKIETEIQYPDGKKVWFIFSLQPIPEGIFVLTTDITYKKKSEIELKRLVQAINQSGEAILMANTHQVIEYVNPAFEMITGYGREEAIDRPLSEMLKDIGDDKVYRTIWQRLEKGLTWRGRLSNHKKDGSLYTQDATVFPVFDSDGNIINYVSVSRDITEYLSLHEEKEKLQAQYMQSQKMESVGRLAGGVAHDFNNMLGVIIGRTELALDIIDPDNPLHKSLQEIEAAANRSAELTRQLLAFARKQTISPIVLDLNETVEGMLNILRRIIGEDIELIWKPGTNLWQIHMDLSQIDQILANLTVNSRDAIDSAGQITIETANVAFDETYCAKHEEFTPGEYVMLTVCDSGIGMDKDTIEHLFEPFFTTKGIGKGTGLGLATVYGIVKQNDGFIYVYSEPGCGTSFKLYFKRYHGKDIEDAEKESQVETLRMGTETILLVEDEEAVRELTQLMMESLGYKVLPAATPNEAIQLVENNNEKIHMIVADVIMPQMTGRDLAEKLKSLLPDSKQLFMSGYASDAIVHHGTLDGGIHFLPKPFSRAKLASKMAEALEG